MGCDRTIRCVVVILGIAVPALADEPSAQQPSSSSATLDVQPVGANDSVIDSGKLLATGGLPQIEGAGGGGLATWALINGYGTDRAIGATAHYTYVYLPNFTLHTAGAGIGVFDRFEITYAHQWFDTRSTGAALGLGNGFTFEQDIAGAKVKLLGDAIYDQDSWLPQIAVGTQYKVNNQGAVIHAIGAKSRAGADFYLATTKLFLAQNLLLDATFRETKANQFGILGFGGDKKDAYSLQFEGSAALLMSRQIAIGAELRTKPDNLHFAREENAGDLFLAYFITKNFSATVAFVSMGDIATRRNQNGVYLSLGTGF